MPSFRYMPGLVYLVGASAYTYPKKAGNPLSRSCLYGHTTEATLMHGIPRGGRLHSHSP